MLNFPVGSETEQLLCCHVTDNILYVSDFVLLIWLVGGIFFNTKINYHENDRGCYSALRMPAMEQQCEGSLLKSPSQSRN